MLRQFSSEPAGNVAASIDIIPLVLKVKTPYQAAVGSLICHALLATERLGMACHGPAVSELV